MNASVHHIWPSLTHWGRVTHICVGTLTIIGSDNGLSPSRRQTIIWTNDGLLLIGTLGTNVNEILIEIHTFLFKNIYLKMSSGKWRPFCLGLNVLTRGGCGNNFKRVILQCLLRIKFMKTSVKPQNTFFGKSTLFQVMAWCHHPTSCC